MAAGRGYVNGHNGSLHWSDFCEEQAVYAASEFYKNFRNYLRENPSLNVRDSASTFLQRFTDCIQSDFYQCVERGQPLRSTSRAYESSESVSYDRSSPASSSTSHSDHKQSKAKSFLRRLSIRKKGRAKDHRDELYSEDHKTKSKQRTNIKKEGIVYKQVENAQLGSSKWEKCRLVLVNNPSGYLLEFYSPPKVCYVHYVLCTFITGKHIGLYAILDWRCHL